MKKPEDMSEAYFRKELMDPWLDEHADYWFPTTGVLCRSGILDYCCVINGKPVYIEAKKIGGVVSSYQKIEIEKLTTKNILVLVVNPLDWEAKSYLILRMTREIRRYF